MGCTNSKGSARKRTARESWYAPLSRSTSAPIHFVAEAEDDGDLRSFDIITLDAQQVKTQTFASLLQAEKEDADDNDTPFYCAKAKGSHVNACKAPKRFAFSRSHMDYKVKLNPVEELSESDAGDVETINAWELMQGLDEDSGSMMASPPRAAQKMCVFEKSLSFSTVHSLDTGFEEAGPPLWRSYFMEQGNEEKKTGEGEVGQQPKTINGLLRSPTKSPIKSPLRSPWKTPMQSPLKSPSPFRSPLLDPSSPLFDPSLLAKFEQAIQAISWPPPQDDWLLTSSINEESTMTTTSTSSINNSTWVLSESSSDDEISPQSVAIAKQTGSSPVEKGGSPQLDTSWDKGIGYVSHDLDSFEYRCPPNGEDKVVLYFTSLRGVRKTFEDCCVVRLILQGLGVHVDERDVWMHSKFREELTDLFGRKRVLVPKLFIKGRYIGGVDDIRQLHEDGFLIKLFEGFCYVGTFRKVCEGCASMRFVPCITCWGSCKVLDEESGGVLRCGRCNENGLIMCPLCS